MWNNDDPVDFPDTEGFTPVVPGCRTVGCIAGELPAVDPDNWVFDPQDGLPVLRGSQRGTTEDLMAYLDLPRSAILHLFYPMGQDVDRYGGCWLYEDATREEVAGNFHTMVDRLYRSRER